MRILMIKKLKLPLAKLEVPLTFINRLYFLKAVFSKGTVKLNLQDGELEIIDIEIFEDKKNE